MHLLLDFLLCCLLSCSLFFMFYQEVFIVLWMLKVHTMLYAVILQVEPGEKETVRFNMNRCIIKIFLNKSY